MKNKKILTVLAASALFLGGCTQAAVTERPARPDSASAKNSDANQSTVTSSLKTKSEPLMPVIEKTGMDVIGLYNKHIYANVHNPNPDLLLLDVWVESVVRDSKGRIIQECVLYLESIEPMGTAVALQNLYVTVPGEDKNKPEVYSVESTISPDCTILGIPSSSASDYASEYVTLSDIVCEYNSNWPELSFTAANGGSEDLDSINFVIDFLYRGRQVYSTKTMMEKTLRAGESYLIEPGLDSIPVSQFDEVRITPTSRQYDERKAVTIQQG